MMTTATTPLVLGLGESGLAMARWLARDGAAVRVWDSRAEPPRAAALREHVPHAEMRRRRARRRRRSPASAAC